MFAAAVAFSLAAVASAQMTHQVMVGQGGLQFVPDTVTAEIGDTVEFTFVSGNHTATVSSFANPCTAAQGGFTSGFQPVPAGATSDNFPMASYTVQTMDPIWFYCGQKNPINHCENGMVFAVNPPTNGSNTFANFQANAKALASGGGASSATSASTAPTSSASAPAASGSAAPTAPSSPTVWPVTVGFNATLNYNPPSINASVGDIVMFTFPVPGNHTATLTSFNTPCVAATNSDGSRVFDTGFETNLTPGSAPIVVNYTVNSTSPQWFGCLQTKPVFHCGAGMVFAINAPGSGNHTFSAFKALAMSQNGTASNTTSGSSPSASPSSGSSSGAVGLTAGAGVLISAVAGVFAFLL